MKKNDAVITEACWLNIISNLLALIASHNSELLAKARWVVVWETLPDEGEDNIPVKKYIKDMGVKAMKRADEIDGEEMYAAYMRELSNRLEMKNGR